MAKHKRKVPAFLHTPAYLALRWGLSLPLIAGTWPSSCAAEYFGRLFAGSPFNRKRLERAKEHLRIAFPEWPPERVDDCAAYAYEHLFRLMIEFCYTPRLLNDDNFMEHVEVLGVGGVNLPSASGLRGVSGVLGTLLRGRRCVLITGHCGNWEVLGYTMAVMGFPMHALYRPLDNPAADKWVRAIRARRGLELVDKFGGMRRLPEVMSRIEPVGFVADQNAGDRGLFVPFFGRLASTYKSPALLAMQYDATIAVAMGRRLSGPEHWKAGRGFRYRVELADVIEPSDWKGRPDPLYYITARYRRGLETLIRASPEQYLWMHRIWKSRPRHERDGKPTPRALAEKIMGLPWLSQTEAAGIVDRSDREAATIGATRTGA